MQVPSAMTMLGTGLSRASTCRFCFFFSVCKALSLLIEKREKRWDGSEASMLLKYGASSLGRFLRRERVIDNSNAISTSELARLLPCAQRSLSQIRAHSTTAQTRTRLSRPLVPRAVPRDRSLRIMGTGGATASTKAVHRKYFVLYVRPIKGNLAELYARAPYLPQEAAERGLLKKKHNWERIKVGKTWRDGEKGEDDAEPAYDGNRRRERGRGRGLTTSSKADQQRWEQRVGRHVIPTLMLTSKKTVHRRAVYRNRCRTRLNAAFRTVLEGETFQSRNGLAQGEKDEMTDLSGEA